MRRVLLGVALLLLTGEVRAQEYIPPPIVAPPPYQPYSYQLDQELAARGHRNKVAGAILIAIGSLSLAAGQALIIYDSVHSFGRRDNIGYLAGGVAAEVAGIAMNAIGIPVYVVGGSQMKRARFRVSASSVRVEF